MDVPALVPASDREAITLAEEEREEARTGEERAPRAAGRKGRGGFAGRAAGGRRPRVCPFCERKVKEVDYKQVDELRHYLTERGKIKPRRKNATCAKHQRRLAVAIKRARHLALLPFTAELSRG
jgi:small subunit ribosomal protein S18